MPPLLTSMATSCASGMLPRFRIKVLAMAGGFPPFVPKEVERIKDTHAIALAKRIEHVPVKGPRGGRALFRIGSEQYYIVIWEEKWRECASLAKMPPLLASMATTHCSPPLLPRTSVSVGGLPPFLPKEVDRIKDRQVIELAKRIERIPVKIDSVKKPIMSSCIKPLQQDSNEAVVLVHGFDSSCLEWRYTYPLLEEAGVEAWAVDLLGWGFSNLETLPPCNVSTKREHLYQLWASYIKKPMVLVGASLGAAVAVDFAVNYPEAVSKLVFVGACVYTKGTGNMTKLPKFIAYAGVNILKILPLRLYAMKLAFNNVPEGSLLDWTRVGQLHCHLPWWEEATVGFMRSGGYNVVDLIKQVKQKTLIIWGEDDRIVSKEFATKLYNDIEGSVLCLIPNCGHLPHVERPQIVIEQILSFCAKENAKADRQVANSNYNKEN